MRTVGLVALLGAVGTLARYGIQTLAQASTKSFPWGTLVINVAGSLLLGFLMAFFRRDPLVTSHTSVALTVGFCGAFTTMSALSYETVTLLNDGQYLRGSAYIVANVGGSIIATVIGIAAGSSAP